MPKRAIALTAVLVTATLTPPAEALSAEPPTPPAPDLDETLVQLELPSRPAESVTPPQPGPAAATPSTASSAAAESGVNRRAKTARSGDPLARIRSCESGSNYNARSASGRYHGAYQFDRATFASVGGKGDPAAASPAEQDRRARILYAKRGGSPWPVCAKRG
ncbi:MAG TPA: transglycosylase family protein [Acidimicrobiales bacterium]|nr:transglycosylase family protein [Acidimicrobiales bacterium]